MSVSSVMDCLNLRRFDHLNEDEVLRRIGGLLATALMRSGRLRRPSPAQCGLPARTLPATVDPVDLIRDPGARQVARYLQAAGPTAPRDLAAALGLSRRTAARRLAQLCAGGICEVVGRTKAARYQIRTGVQQNTSGLDS
jgi:CRP-like cAMP-binding protein